MHSSGFWSSFCAWCWCRCATSAEPAATARQRHSISLILLAGLLGLAIGRCWHLPANRPVSSISPSMPTLTQIRELSELATAKVTITDVRQTNLSGYLGDVKAILMVRGDVLLGADLSRAKIVSCNPASRCMILELPQPHLISCRLDHSATRLVSLTHDGLWVIVPGDAGRTAVLNRAYAEAEHAAAQAAVTPQAIQDAADKAQHVLQLFFATDGWTVQIHWNNAA